MKYNFKKILFLNFFVLGFFACPVSICGVLGVEEARAEDLYVSDAGAGISDGSSCDQAYSVSWFNDSDSWGTGDEKISDDDTVYLCGTITSDFLRLWAYGSVGNPYIITSAPGQTAVVDGQNTLISGIMTYANSSGEVVISNLEVRNIVGSGIVSSRTGVALKIDNVTVSNVSQSCIGLTGDGAYIKNSNLSGCGNNGINGNTVSNGVIDNNIITLSGTYNDAITLHDGTGSNNTISNNIVSGIINENAIDIQSGYSNTTIFRNDLSGASQYVILNAGLNTSIHKNFIHDSARGLYLTAPTRVFYNKLVNLSDDTLGSLGGSGGIYFTSTADSGLIYNNTFTEGTQATGRPMITLSSGVNDTVLKNNIFDENKSQTTIYIIDNSSLGLQSDYNSFNTPYNRLVLNATTIYENLIDWKAVGYDAGSVYGEQLFSDFDSRDLSLRSDSMLVDSGTDVGLTTDYAGNPIYGAPDIGAYEYQPPHTIGNDRINIQAGARIYGDAKFRDLKETGETGADLTITPQNNFETYEADEIRPAFLDITNITWTAQKKEWTESSEDVTLTNTIHTVGDFTPNIHYYIKVDNELKNITGEDCKDSICKANEEGKLTFAYTGNYSTHAFQITPREGEIITELTDADLKINNNKEALDKDTKLYLDKDKAKLKGTNPEIANGKVKIYKDNKLYKEIDVDENGKWSKTISFGHNHNYKIKVEFFDEFNTLRDTKEYEIKVDTEKPVFQNKEESSSVTKDERISFPAEDEETKIDYYKIKVLDKNGQIIRKWKKQKEDFYEIPEKIKDEAKIVIVRVYDRVGNKEELVFDVEPRKALPRGGAQAKLSVTDSVGEVQEVLEVKTEELDQQEESQESLPETTTGNNSPEIKTEIQPTASEKPATNPPASGSKWWNPFNWFKG